MKELKKIYVHFAVISSLFLIYGCNSFSDALDTPKIAPITVAIHTAMDVPDIDNIDGLKIVLTNHTEGVRVEKEMADTAIEIDNLIPGKYSVVITGRTQNNEGIWYYLNGSLINKPLLVDHEKIEITISGMQISPLVFKEIFYSGTQKNYFRNQFYEIYNNSDEELFLDGIYFCILHPGKATTTLPVWPEEDGNKYVYTDRLWRFPGSGTDYPLQPGESCVISQFAANHQLDIYNPDSPIDGSSSEFEFNMNNANFPDQPAYDMEHVFFDGTSNMGSTPQYLTSVFGAAYVIFKVPEGETYDPVNNKALQTRDLRTSAAKLYAKIPIEYVLDGVEAIDNENLADAKRMPGVLDAGFTTVGATYNSLSVARKKIAENPDGTPILQDTNNSTDDFDSKLVPQLRRHGAKMPSWNHTLQ